MAFPQHSIFKPFAPLGDGDVNKPNFIFSSDIPRKVKSIVDKYFKARGTNGTVIDFTDKTIEFNVNIELNTILLRNCTLKPSDLIKDNLIFLAKSKTSSTSTPLALLTIQYPPKLQNIYKVTSEEVFIVSLSLRLIDFIINLQNLPDHRIDFLKDECYGLLVLCDLQLVDDLEKYIAQRFVVEIEAYLGRNKEDSETDEKVNGTTKSSETKEPSEAKEPSETNNASKESKEPINAEKEPINALKEPNGALKEPYSALKEPNGSLKANGDVTETKIKSSARLFAEEVSFIPSQLGLPEVNTDISFSEPTSSPSKSQPFFDGDEYDSSLEELVLLRSNDTNKSTGDDDLFDERVFLDQRKNLPRKKRQERFIGDMNNLRHNEEEVILLDDIDEIDDDIESDDDDPIDNLATTSLKNDILPPPLDEQFVLKSPVALRPDRSDLESPGPLSPMKSATRQLSMPTLLSRKPSLALINYEDNNDDLEFAFKATSPLVPSYIKQDKKFKFIKVGKVQKFVNLFEEKGDSANTSRTSTRPPSPLK